jgi:hypothetical protein
MNKGEFIFHFFLKELVVVVFGGEMAVIKVKEPEKEPINLPSSWYFEAIKTFENRFKN